MQRPKLDYYVINWGFYIACGITFRPKDEVPYFYENDLLTIETFDWGETRVTIKETGEESYFNVFEDVVTLPLLG